MIEKISFYGNYTEEFPINLTYAGISYCDGSYRISRNSNRHIFVFEAVEQGCGTLHIDSETFYPRTGDVFITPGWKKHTFFSDASNPWVKHWFNVKGPLPEMLLQVYSLNGQYYFENCPEACKVIFETVSELKKMNANEAQNYIQTRILLLVMELRKHVLKTASALNKRNPAASKLHSFLMSRVLTNPPTLEEMGKLVGYSKAQAIRLFHEEFGMTPYAFLLSQKINTAADMLCNTGQTIKGIADTIGFNDEYYFSRIFKKKMGITPGEYRKKQELKLNSDGPLPKDPNPAAP